MLKIWQTYETRIEEMKSDEYAFCLFKRVIFFYLTAIFNPAESGPNLNRVFDSRIIEEKILFYFIFFFPPLKSFRDEIVMEFEFRNVMRDFVFVH